MEGELDAQGKGVTKNTTKTPWDRQGIVRRSRTLVKASRGGVNVRETYEREGGTLGRENP